MTKIISSTETVPLDKINWSLLGAIRFFLAFIVLTEHLGWYIDEPDNMLKFSKFSPLVAVLGFLVISGFSIAASFEVKQKGFYFRRAMRVIPVYFISIFFSIFVVLYSSEHSLVNNGYVTIPEIPVILGNLFFMQGILVHSLESNPVVWTLAVEMFFYIITPILNAQNKYFLYSIFVSALLFSAQRYIGFYYFSQMLYGLNILFLGWAWLIGFWCFHNRNNSGAIFFISSLGVVAIMINGFFVDGFWGITWIITCAAIGYGHLIKMPFSVFSRVLGDISYPMYLLHIPCFCLIKNFISIELGFYYFIIVVVLCLFVDIFIDKPLKRLINLSVLKLA